MVDVLEALNKLSLSVQGAQTIPVGRKTKLNTFFTWPCFRKETEGRKEEVGGIFIRYS